MCPVYPLSLGEFLLCFFFQLTVSSFLTLSSSSSLTNIYHFDNLVPLVIEFCIGGFCLCLTALELIEHLRAMGETNCLFQTNTVMFFLSFHTYGPWILNWVSSNAEHCMLTETDPEEGHSLSNCSYLWFNVCCRRWHCTCNLPGNQIRSVMFIL